MVRGGADYIAATHECPDCRGKSRLTVRWEAALGRDSVWCPVCRRQESDGFRRRESITARWKRDRESVPVTIAGTLERKYGMQPMSGRELAVANENTMLQRIESSRWLKSLSADDRRSLAQLSVQYGFDPLMKELVIYEGSPYITVAGLIRMAHRQKMFAGVEDRPMSEEERKQYGYNAPVCWIAKVYRKDWRVPAVGTGRANPDKPLRENPIERHHPEWMARSRALRQALKLAFPHFLPFEEFETAEERGIDPETGEILDGQAVAVSEPNGHDEAPEGFVDEVEVVDYDDDDLQAKIAERYKSVGALAGRLNISSDQLETYCNKHYSTSFAGLNLDSLIDLEQVLTARAAAKAGKAAQ